MIEVRSIDNNGAVINTDRIPLVSPADVGDVVLSALMAREMPHAVTVVVESNESGYRDRRVYTAIRDVVRSMGPSLRRLIVQGRTTRVYGIIDMG